MAHFLCQRGRLRLALGCLTFLILSGPILASRKRHLKARAGGSSDLSLLLFALGIALVVDLSGLLLYNIGQRGIAPLSR